MNRLIRFEIRKLFRMRALYFCAGILVFVILLFAGINKLEQVVVDEMMSEIPVGEESVQINSSDDMPEELSSIMGIGGRHTAAAEMLKALSNIYVFIVFAAFSVVFYCGDFGNGTVKNVITKGYSRTEIFFSKYIVCLGVLLCYSLLSMLTGFLCGLFMWEMGDEWSMQIVSLVLLQLLAAAAFNALFGFLSSLMKNTGSALALAIAIPIGIPLILSLVDLLATDIDAAFSEYWLSGCISLAASTQATTSQMVKSAGISAAYCVLFTAGGWFFCRKKEV